MHASTMSKPLIVYRTNVVRPTPVVRQRTDTGRWRNFACELTLDQAGTVSRLRASTQVSATTLPQSLAPPFSPGMAFRVLLIESTECDSLRVPPWRVSPLDKLCRGSELAALGYPCIREGGPPKLSAWPPNLLDNNGVAAVPRSDAFFPGIRPPPL